MTWRTDNRAEVTGVLALAALTSLANVAEASPASAVPEKAGGSGAPPGYAMYAGATLVPAIHGVRGHLQLLQDERLSATLRDYVAGGGYCNEQPSDHPEFCESVARTPLRPAIVRLTDADGHDVASRTLPRELAYLETQYLYGTGKPTYLVTVDLRAGAGGWAPICTSFAEVQQGSLRWLSAGPTKDGSPVEITLCKSHHADWRVASSRRRRERDLAFVEGGVDGTVSIGRYRWSGNGWQLIASRSAGSWDADRPFPDLGE